jgi:hypothetical protein
MSETFVASRGAPARHLKVKPARANSVNGAEQPK